MARPKRGPDEQLLSPTEWQIMRILWRIGRAPVRRILREDLKRKGRDRDYRTILTFVSRMEKKGFLSVEKEGNTNYYTPVVSKKKGLQEEISRFSTRPWGTSLKISRSCCGPSKRSSGGFAASTGRRLGRPVRAT